MQKQPAVPSIPCVDIAPLVGGWRLRTPTASPSERTAASSLDVAARTAGFFYVTGHGIPEKSMAGALLASERLFALPLEHKMMLRAKGGEGAGYEPSGAQQLDEGRLDALLDFGSGAGVDGESQGEGDQKESYILGNMTGHGGTLEAQWPVGLEGFHEAVTRYHADCLTVAAALMRGFAIALGLPPDRFVDDMDDPFTKLRLLRYPALTKDGSACVDPYGDSRVGCGAHTDWGALTLLVQDDVGGLEVCAPSPHTAAVGEAGSSQSQSASSAVWMPADARPGAILANVGDMLMRWTDGRYRSAAHRVLRPKTAGVNRCSVAFFLNCNADAVVDAAALGLVGGGSNSAKKPKWPPITAMGYIEERVAATYSA